MNQKDDYPKKDYDAASNSNAAAEAKQNELFDFNAMLDKHLYRESRPKTVGRYYPSEVGSCLRKTWFSFKFPIEFDAEKRRIFETGNILHEYVVHVFKSGKTPEVELLKSEMPFVMNCGEFVVSGRVDDVLLVKSSGQTVLVEVKSASRMPRGPSKHHAAQLQFYMHATGVHNGALLYVEKNTLNSIVYTVPYDEHAAADGIQRFAILHKALLEDAAPEPEAKLRQDMRWWCDYCEYNERCASTKTGEASGVKCGEPQSTQCPPAQSPSTQSPSTQNQQTKENEKEKEKEKGKENPVEEKAEPPNPPAAAVKPKQKKLEF